MILPKTPRQPEGTQNHGWQDHQGAGMPIPANSQDVIATAGTNALTLDSAIRHALEDNPESRLCKTSAGGFGSGTNEIRDQTLDTKTLKFWGECRFLKHKCYPCKNSHYLAFQPRWPVLPYSILARRKCPRIRCLYRQSSSRRLPSRIGTGTSRTPTLCRAIPAFRRSIPGRTACRPAAKRVNRFRWI